MDERSVRPDASPWPARLLACVVALLVTGPALGPGFVLLRDMVFVPRQDIDLDALGLSGGLPRAVPVDSVVALVTRVVPGDLLQKAVLLGVVYAAVLGAARLVPPADDGRRGIAAVVAGLVYGWSPYLAERLLMGHWTFLVAWAALPWIARAALRLRAGEPRAGAWLVVTLAPAALSSTGALLGGAVAVVVAGRRRAPLAAGIAVVLSLPWLVAGALSEAGGASDPSGVAAFAARGESWGGAVVSLLGTGGIWNAEATPTSRASVLAPVLTLLVLALAVAGWATGGELRGPGRALVLLGVAGLVLAAAGSLPGTRDLLEFAVRAVPGAGLLRDGQKWIAWWGLPLALGAGLGTRRLVAVVSAAGGRGVAVLAAGAAVVLPLIAVPDLVWGVGGRLHPVEYPADWQRVRTALAADRHPGDVLVLPFSTYRAFAWNADRPQLDPAPRWLTRVTLADDSLVVGGSTVAGEDPRARQAAAAAGDPAALAALGVGWVLVERGTPGPAVPPAVASLSVELRGRDLDLYRVPDARPAPRPSPGRVTAVVLAHAGALVTAVGGLLWIAAAGSTVALRRPLRKRIAE